MTTLKDLSPARKAAIAERWRRDALAAYPPGASALFDRENDPFGNPVGHALRAGAEAMLEALLDGMDPDRIRRPLEDILRIRAVQEMSPSQAVSFVFLLKDAFRAEMGEAWGDPRLRPEREEIEARVDRIALLAFDLYMRCRERVCELRVNEMRRNVVQAVERLNRSRPQPEAAGGADR